jgi:hypothetical protein
MSKGNGSAVAMLANKPKKPASDVRLDIGCGPNPREGFDGVDQYSFEGKVKHVLDIRDGLGRWKDSSVSEIWCSHFLEHLTAMERCAFLNECYRVLKPDASMTVITPHWASNRAYGDPTHAWPPVSEMFFYYISREWREREAPHTDAKHLKGGYACDFAATWGYTLNPSILAFNQDRQQYALQNYKEAAMDIQATLTAKKGKK